MRNLGILLLLAAAGGGLWYGYQRYEIRGLGQVQVVPRGSEASPAPASAPAAAPTARGPAPARSTIRVATFNLGRFEESRLANPRVREVLGQVLSRFDVVALEEIRARNQGLVVRLVEQLNAAGRQYDYAIAPTVQADVVEQYSAFLFDATSIEVDRFSVDTIEAAGTRLTNKPLVGQFRARGAAADEAFTFRLLAVAVEPTLGETELPLVAAAYRALRDRGQEEDDLILLGTFNADRPQMAQLEQSLGLFSAIDNMPTTTRGTGIADNIVFHRRATAEFTGRAGVVDLLREFNLNVQEAMEISEHLPVWAEFSVYEGGQPGLPK